MAKVELRGYRKAQTPMKTLGRLFGYFRHAKVTLIFAVISIVAYVIATIGASTCWKPVVSATMRHSPGIRPC